MVLQMQNVVLDTIPETVGDNDGPEVRLQKTIEYKALFLKVKLWANVFRPRILSEGPYFWCHKVSSVTLRSFRQCQNFVTHFETPEMWIHTNWNGEKLLT